MIIPKNVESGTSFGITTLTIVCDMCKKNKVIYLTNQEYCDYFVRGIHVQKAMPNQSDDIRELCISGTCDKCFDKLFENEENED